MEETEEQNQVENNEEIKGLRLRNDWLSSLLISFILLFVLFAGLLAYYQFYQGNGQWRFTLKHKNNDTVFNKITVAPVNYDSVNKQVDSLKLLTAGLQNRVVQDSIQLEIEKSRVAEPVPFTADITKPYLVQLGIFRNYDLSKYSGNMQYMEQHSSDGLNTITIGRFSTQKEAELFAKDMKALGIAAPIIAKAENGKITPIKTAVKKPAAKKKTTTKKRRR